MSGTPPAPAPTPVAATAPTPPAEPPAAPPSVDAPTTEPAPPAARRPARDESPGAPMLAVEPPFQFPPLRAVIGIIAIFVVVGGVLYPLAVDGFARGTGGFNEAGGFVPGGAAGQLVADRIGYNITNVSLFWLRPSLDDYNTTLESGEAPYGPTDPNLVNLTRYYLSVYGLNNTTAPLELVSPSESGIDPDVDPAGALVQIPRVAAHTNLSEAYLTAFVEAHVQQPVLGLFGAPVVDVIALDQALVTVLAEETR